MALKRFCHGRHSKPIRQILRYGKKESKDTHKSLSKHIKFNGKTMLCCHTFQQLCRDELLSTEGFRKKQHLAKTVYITLTLIAQKLVSLRKPIQLHKDAASILH